MPFESIPEPQTPGDSTKHPEKNLESLFRAQDPQETSNLNDPKPTNPHAPNPKPSTQSPEPPGVLRPRAPAEHPSFTHVPAQKLEVSTAPRGFGGFVVVAGFRVWGLGFRGL